MTSEPVFDEDQFAHTVIRLEFDDEWLEVTPVEPGASNLLPFDGTVHIISGCNPGYRESDQTNARLHRELEGRLRKLGSVLRPAIGMSPDRAWMEPSWAVIGSTREEMCALGFAFGQVAIFEIDSCRIHVVRCADSEVVSTRPYRVGRNVA